MISKNQIKYISSLQNKKFRKEFNCFVAEGNKLVEEALKSDFRIERIVATKNWLDKSTGFQDIEIIEATENEISKISSLSTPQEVLAVVKIPDFKTEFNDLQNKLTLVLNDIKDPGNLGTIIRLCDWFGIENLICSAETVDVYNPKTVQSTMGSIFRIKTFYTSLPEFLDEAKMSFKPEIYGAFLDGENIYKTEFKKTGFVVLGSESHGISAEVEKFIDRRITIPKFNNSQTESLNVAISAAIICSEFCRR